MRIALLILAASAALGCDRIESNALRAEVLLLDRSNNGIPEQTVVAFRPTPCLSPLDAIVPKNPGRTHAGSLLLAATDDQGRARFVFEPESRSCGFPSGHVSTWLVDPDRRVDSDRYGLFIVLRPVERSPVLFFYQDPDEVFVLFPRGRQIWEDSGVTLHADWRVSNTGATLNIEAVVDSEQEASGQQPDVTS